MTHTLSQQNEQMAVIDVDEELNHGRRETANELRDMCKSLEQQGVLQFILNFEKIKLCPSIVFGNLLVLGRHLASKGGRIYLTSPSEHVEKAARITGLTSTVSLSHSVDEAIQSISI